MGNSTAQTYIQCLEGTNGMCGSCSPDRVTSKHIRGSDACRVVWGFKWQSGRPLEKGELHQPAHTRVNNKLLRREWGLAQETEPPLSLPEPNRKLKKKQKTDMAKTRGVLDGCVSMTPYYPLGKQKIYQYLKPFS